LDRANFSSAETDRGATMPKPTRDLGDSSVLFRTLWYQLCEIVIFSGATPGRELMTSALAMMS